MVYYNTLEQKIFNIITAFILIILSLIIIYPVVYVLFASLSDPVKLMSNTKVLVKPLGFSVEAYKLVFKHPLLLSSYKNTIIYVVVGTSINLFMTTLGAYVLSRRDAFFKKYIMIMVVITMFFGGGLIPSWLLVKNLGMLDTMWALVIPGAISAWNMIIMRTGFMALPSSLEESATIDGANDFVILWRIILPMAKPVIAVMVLFYGVSHWNSWFGAMIYLRSREKYPLQLVLREILVTQTMRDIAQDIDAVDFMPIEQTIKYATIVVATVPIMCVYPFLQKYFAKGVLIGALKG